MNGTKALFAAAASAAALATHAAAPRWFVVNEDNDHFFKCNSALMDEKGLSDYVDYICRGKVTHVFFCVCGQRTSYDSKTWEPIWKGLDEAARPDTATRPDGTHDRWAVNAKKLHDAGIDPYDVWIRRCREKGVSPWVSMRMNDVHFFNVTNFFRNTSWYKAHPEYRLDPSGTNTIWFMNQLDFAHAEVRAYSMAQAKEIAERWPSDGVELDWMRFGHVFKPGEERANAHLLDGFMREASAAIRAAGRKVAVRVPYDPEVCEEFGFNVAAWAREGLVDVVIPAPFFMAASDLPVEDWREALDGTKALLVPDLGCEVNASDRAYTPTIYRGIAQSFVSRGADGVYVFNLPYKSNAAYSADSRGKAWCEKLDVAAEIYERGMIPESNDVDYDCPVALHDWPNSQMRNNAKWDAFFAGKRREYGALQSAIDAKSEAGGGRVDVEGTVWCDGPIVLKSGVELHFADGAKLVFTDNPERYPAVRSSWEGVECLNHSPLVYAYGQTNVAITGRGTIAPRMERWKDWIPRTPEHMAATRRLYDWCSFGEPVENRDLTKVKGANVRPQLVQFNRCADVRLEGFRVRQSPFWVLHLYLCRGVHVKDVDVVALGNNTDGIDIEMTRDVLVEGCTFREGDDAIVVKAGRNRDGWRLATPSENIEIRNCTIHRGNAVVGIGSEMSGGVRNVWVHDCVFDGFGGSLLQVKTNERRGGFVRDVRMERVEAHGRLLGSVLSVSMDAMFQWRDFPTHEVRVSDISGIRISDVHVERAGRRVSIREDARKPVRDVVLDNVVVDKVDLQDLREPVRKTMPE